MPEPNDASVSTVLLVADVADDLISLETLLAKDYRVQVATDAARALALIESDSPPDLILLDPALPGRSGQALCQRVKADPARRHLPILFLTRRDEPESELEAFALGAADHLTKPLAPAVVAARVRTQLELAAARQALARQNELLATAAREATLAARHAHDDLREAYLHAIDLAYGLMSQADDWLGHHCRRVAAYSLRLAHRLGLDEATTFDLRVAAMLHDLGLLGVPRPELEALFLLPQPSASEHAAYRAHPVSQLQGLATSAQFRRTEEIIAAHHENLDGSGFPGGLTGDRISLPARILAVADRWDIYAQVEPIPPDRPRRAEEFVARGGGKLDPRVLGALVEELREGDPFSRIVDRPLAELEPGMVVATTFRSADDAVLVRAGTLLRFEHIDALRRLAEPGGSAATLQVYRRGVPHP